MNFKVDSPKLIHILQRTHCSWKLYENTNKYHYIKKDYDCDVEDILVMIYLNLMTLFQEPGLDQEETQWPGRDHALGEDPGNINNYSNIRIILDS